MTAKGEGISLTISELTKSYRQRTVLQGIDLNVKDGEFLAIIGKSGCEKSTFLRLIGGLEEPDKGKIYVNGQPLKGFNHESRMMFQDGRLLPWKKVIDNVGLGIKGKWKERALEALCKVGLEERKDDWPSVLSGGQKQRVALARALVNKPSLLLLDEPLGALDALTRIEMQEIIERIWEETKLTSLLVTHDVEEAVALANRVILIEHGKIVMDVPVHIERPRYRNDPAFVKLTSFIRNRVLSGGTGEVLGNVHYDVFPPLKAAAKQKKA